MSIYKVVRIPRPDGLDPAKLSEYHRFLNDTIFPLVDELQDAGLIEGYDFLTRSDIDLRLWILGKAKLERIRAVLRGRDLPDTLDDFAPAEAGEDRTILLDLLHRDVQQVRTLLQDTSGERSIQDVVHWFLNQYGLSNASEVQWHFEQACAWFHTIRVQAQGPREDHAADAT